MERYRGTAGCILDAIVPSLGIIAVVTLAGSAIKVSNEIEYRQRLYETAITTVADTDEDRFISQAEVRQMYEDMGVPFVEDQDPSWRDFSIADLNHYIDSHRIIVPQETLHPDYE
jgi:hypothetical protein